MMLIVTCKHVSPFVKLIFDSPRYIFYLFPVYSVQSNTHWYLFVWWCITPLSTIFQLYRSDQMICIEEKVWKYMKILTFHWIKCVFLTVIHWEGVNKSYCSLSALGTDWQSMILIQKFYYKIPKKNKQHKFSLNTFY